MEKKNLRRLSRGLYCDDRGILYVYIQDFLARHGMPDRPEVRAALYGQIRQEFGNVPIVVCEGPAPEEPEA